jgi:hypothetical protein
MAILKLPHRDSLGWLIPILLFFVFYGGYLSFNADGFLHQLGIFFVLGGVIGLSFSRRVRRLVTYYITFKTSQSRESFLHESMMEAARRMARKEKIPELVTELYFTYIVHLPEWIQLEKPAEDVIIPTVISSAKKASGNRIMVTLSGREYIFTFVQYVYSTVEGERDVRATLQVACQNEKLILLHLTPEAEGSHMPFWPASIEYVQMTDWINEFKHLKELVSVEREHRRHEDRMD